LLDFFFEQAKMDHIYNTRKQAGPSAQDVQKSSTKVYKKVQVNNMSKVQLVDAQTKQWARPPVIIVGS
jgi:hypothetical protein